MTGNLRYFSNDIIDKENSSQFDAQDNSWPFRLKDTSNKTIDTANFELAFYSELAQSKDIRDFYNRIMDIANSFGFSDFAFVRGACAGNEFPLITNTREHINAYFEAGFCEYDLLEQYRKKNTKPTFLSWLYQYAIDAPYSTDATCANQAISELNESFGYFDYYNVFMKSHHNDEDVMLGVSRKGLDPHSFQLCVPPYKASLKLLCRAIDYLSITKFPTHFLACEKDEIVTITPQPLRVLCAMANNDLPITQLAEKLFISPITAHQHITAARKALGTKTNVGAIKKAIKLGLITYD